MCLVQYIVRTKTGVERRPWDELKGKQVTTTSQITLKGTNVPHYPECEHVFKGIVQTENNKEGRGERARGLPRLPSAASTVQRRDERLSASATGHSAPNPSPPAAQQLSVGQSLRKQGQRQLPAAV